MGMSPKRINEYKRCVLLVVCLLFTKAVCSAGEYLGPEEMLFVSSDELCILERDASRLDFFSLAEKKVTRSIPLAQTPNRLSLCGNRLFVTCGDLNGEVLEIDLPTLTITRRWTGIHSPWGVACAEKRGLLCVGRRFHGDVLLFDLNQIQIGKRR